MRRVRELSYNEPSVSLMRYLRVYSVCSSGLHLPVLAVVSVVAVLAVLALMSFSDGSGDHHSDRPVPALTSN